MVKKNDIVKKIGAKGEILIARVTGIEDVHIPYLTKVCFKVLYYDRSSHFDLLANQGGTYVLRDLIILSKKEADWAQILFE
jgi:hypothetical protein